MEGAERESLRRIDTVKLASILGDCRHDSIMPSGKISLRASSKCHNSRNRPRTDPKEPGQRRGMAATHSPGAQTRYTATIIGNIEHS